MSFRALDGVRKSNAHWLEQKGDSWACMNQVDFVFRHGWIQSPPLFPSLSVGPRLPMFLLLYPTGRLEL